MCAGVTKIPSTETGRAGRWMCGDGWALAVCVCVDVDVDVCGVWMRAMKRVFGDKTGDSASKHPDKHCVQKEQPRPIVADLWQERGTGKQVLT